MSEPVFKVGHKIITRYAGEIAYGTVLDPADEDDDGGYFYTIGLDGDPDSFYAFGEHELHHYPFTMHEMAEFVYDLVAV